MLWRRRSKVKTTTLTTIPHSADTIPDISLNSCSLSPLRCLFPSIKHLLGKRSRQPGRRGTPEPKDVLERGPHRARLNAICKEGFPGGEHSEERSSTTYCELTAISRSELAAEGVSNELPVLHRVAPYYTSTDNRAESSSITHCELAAEEISAELSANEPAELSSGSRSMYSNNALMNYPSGFKGQFNQPRPYTGDDDSLPPRYPTLGQPSPTDNLVPPGSIRMSFHGNGPYPTDSTMSNFRSSSEYQPVQQSYVLPNSPTSMYNLAQTRNSAQNLAISPMYAGSSSSAGLNFIPREARIDYRRHATSDFHVPSSHQLQQVDYRAQPPSPPQGSYLPQTQYSSHYRNMEIPLSSGSMSSGQSHRRTSVASSASYVELLLTKVMARLINPGLYFKPP